MSDLTTYAQAREYVVRVALGHPKTCRCLACMAAHGDVGAMEQVMDGMGINDAPAPARDPLNR